MSTKVIVDGSSVVVIGGLGPQGATGPAGGGGVADGDKGDIVVSSSGATWTIDDDAVTFGKMQNVTGPTLLGRAAATSGNAEQIGLAAALTINGSKQLDLSSALAAQSITLTAGTGLTGGGDLSANRTFAVSYGTSSTTACVGNDSRLSDTRTPTDASVTTAKIVDASVTYEKIQDVSAASRLLGRGSASGSGDVQELTVGSGLTISGTELSATGGGGGAPTGASYVVLATDATLTAERVLTAGTGLTLTDGGAGGNATLAASYGTSSTTACVGNDSRLSDDREPLLTKRTRLVSHFVGDAGWLAANTVGGSCTAASTDGVLGVWSISSGATATTNRRSSLTATGTATMALDEATSFDFVARAQVATNFDGTNTGIMTIGLHDNGAHAGSTTTDPVDGAYFRSTNGGTWRAVTRSNSVETAHDTTIAADATWRRFRVEVTGSGTTAKFYVDGTLQTTSTTNIPTGTGRRVGMGFFVNRSAATTTVGEMLVDWVHVDIEHSDLVLT